MKKEAVLNAISRINKSAPWRISVRIGDEHTFFNVGTNGTVTSSPKFQMFLSDLEAEVSRYPVDINFYHIEKDRSIELKVVNNRIVYMDCEFNINNLIKKARIDYQNDVLGTPLLESNTKPEEDDVSFYGMQSYAESGKLASTTMDYVVVAQVSSVTDGDTIKAIIKTEPNKVTGLKIGDRITVRLNGIDAPEYKTNTDAHEYKDSKNSKFARAYGVKRNEIERVAIESKDRLSALIGSKTGGGALVAIHFDRSKNGQKPIKDSFDRYIADVYAARLIKNATIFLKEVQKGSRLVHLNKTMLVENSKAYTHIPLAIYTIKQSYKGTSMLNTVGWGEEIGVSPMDLVEGTSTNEEPDNSLPNGVQGPPEANKAEREGKISYDKKEEPKPNSNNFFPPYDDRIQEFIGDIKTVDDMTTHSRLRIGDVNLVVPPTAIQINKTSQISKLKTLRTKSSIMVNSGKTLTTLTLDLYFHDLESINGRAIPKKKGSKDVFYVDGLRPLLAQFSKAPFLPIDNYFINEIVGIQDVAMMNFELNTVPDFPESMVASITLIEFNTESYLMDETSLSESINYPMLRWFYNQSFSEAGRNEKYRSFDRIDKQIDNNISFTLADENELIRRQDAIEWIKSADSPEKVKVDLKTKNSAYTTRLKDQANANSIMSQVDKYKALNIRRYGLINFYVPNRIKKPSSLKVVRALVGAYGIAPLDAENQVTAANEHFLKIYSEALRYENLATQKNIFIPYEAEPFFKHRLDFNPTKDGSSNYKELPVDYTKKPYKGLESTGLIIIEKMDDPGNQALLESIGKGFYNKSDKRYYIPATNKARSTIRQIGQSAKNMEKATETYEEVFNQNLRIIDSSEQGVQMRPFEISGTFIPVSVSARFENEFSMVHVLGGEAPTLQYLGGGDPYLDIVIEMDDDAAEDFTELLRLSDFYSKTYNKGITNGFIGVQNQMAQLLGMKYLMFENVQINTVHGFPGRYQATIQAVGFDKTQRQREELKGIPNSHENVTLETLRNNKYDFANDRLLEARMPNLEVYPDMELPTYHQLNIALEGMDALCDTYPNREQGLYVDPDFYMSTGPTMRELIERDYKGSHQMNMADETGISIYSSSTDAVNVYNTTKEDFDALQAIDDTEGVEPLDWVFSWGDKTEDNTEADTSGVSTSAGSGVFESKEVVDFDNKTVQDYLLGRDGKGGSYPKFPTKTEWNRLFPQAEYKYSDFSHDPNGTEKEIYLHLDRLVDKYFGGIYILPDLIKDTRGDMDKASRAEKEITYATPADLASVSHSVMLTNMSSIEVRDRKILKQAKKDGLIKSPPEPKGDIVNSNFITLSQKITKERFMTLMKAFLDKTSGWKHFIGDAPIVSSAGRIGIAQYDIKGQHTTKDDVKRLMYNWKYNLEKAVSSLAVNYKAVAKLDDKVKNFEAYSRPWDAMFAMYENPSKAVKRHKDINNSDIATGVMNRFNHYAYRPFNTYSGYNTELYKKLSGLTATESVVLNGVDKNDYIKNLLELEYYDIKVLKKHGIKVKNRQTDNEKLAEIRKVMKPVLEAKSKEQLSKLLETHILALRDLEKQHLTKLDQNGYLANSSVFNTAREMSSALEGMDKSYAQSTQSNDTRLFNDVDPHILYQEMFHDLRNFDQRGRMIRAFPGFQMFIIHEGDFYGKYKFWDNMYGFNAISSIDVHKTRTVAADTAIIEMSNVYSNLTTRRTDVDYVDREIKWWDNMLWNKPPEEMVEKKKNEEYKNIFLEPGARIHLRMGYNSDVSQLPVVFNGTIAEVNVGDVVQVVAQGDGVELGNVLSGDPKDNNDGLFNVTEPRDLICKMMSSKGGWWKDIMNGVTNGSLFQRNPLGIQHFGQPFDVADATAAKPLGNLLWTNDEYGEVAQNIYSANGTPTYSQWLHPNGERNNLFSGQTWSNLWENKYKIFNPGDEDNVVIKFYNNTVWDVIQTIAHTSTDYIAAVAPFEFRSTLFFGKPYWRCSFEYGSTYNFDETTSQWERYLNDEIKRPYMQHRFYNAHQDIISNDIKASDDGMFTNVIVNYDGKQTPVLYADADIRYDKQRTKVVEADIVAKLGNFYTSEVVATHFGISELRDNLKTMYRGNLTVLGDPSVKPHDMMNIADDINDMHGPALVRSVTHHFSIETGFITSIEPDLMVVSDDQVMMDVAGWSASMFTSLFAGTITNFVAKKALLNTGSWLLSKTGNLPAKVGEWLASKGVLKSMRIVDDGSPAVTAAIQHLKAIIQGRGIGDTKTFQLLVAKELDIVERALKATNIKKGVGGLKIAGKRAYLTTVSNMMRGLAGESVTAGKVAKSAKSLGAAVRGVASTNLVGIVTSIVFWIGAEMIFEKLRRYKENLQCVIAMPLTYRGKEFVAGINSHAGMIVGDVPGKTKQIFDATFFGETGAEAEATFGITLMKSINAITGSGGTLNTESHRQKVMDDFFTEIAPYADAAKMKELNRMGGIER